MPNAPVTPPTAIADRYVIERELGQGGMATVFRAIDLKHARPVALKVLRAELGRAVGPDRFLREITVLSTLTHPHIVPLIDSGSSNGVLYYVMPLIEGETLRDRLRREPQLPVGEAIRITREVADGLRYAHAHGVVHRDLKPENILLADGHALLADFGIACALQPSDDRARLTESGLAIGSPLYMSPEQASGEGRVDARADFYGLGCVLYEMLAGVPPFSGPTPQAIMARHACDPVPPLRTVRAKVPPHLEALLLDLLAKSPADRPPTATAIVEALDHPAAPPRLRARTIALIAALVAGLAVAGYLGFGMARGASGNPDWLMVADFVGPDGDPTLAAAVRDLVTVELDQSPSFATMPRQQVAAALRAAGFPDSSSIGPEVARELAYRSSVRGVVTGSIFPLPEQAYSVTLRVLSAEDGGEIASVAGPVTAGRFIGEAQDLARRLRRSLGERRSAIAATRPLEQIATPSFAAFRLFVEGRDRANAGDYAGGNRLLHQAIGLDSAFASAWAMLGTSHVFGRNLDSARLAFSRALALPERLAEDQRFRVEADAAYALRHDLTAAISWYDLYLSRNPRSGAAHNNRALFLSSLGRHEEALQGFRRALEVNPFGPEQVQVELLNQAAELVVMGRTREAEAAAGDLEGPFARYFAVLLPSARSEWARAESTAAGIAELEGIPGFLRIQAITTRAAARAARGGLLQADRVLRAAADGSQGEEMRWYDQARLLLATVGGRPPGPVPHRLAADTSTAGLLLHALWAASAGDTGAATRALERAAARREEIAALGAAPRLARALIDAGAGRWRVVLDSLAPVAWRGEHDATVLDRGSAFLPRWLVADAYARLGRVDSAAAYLELVVAPTRMAPGHVALRGIPFPYAHRRLSVWYLALGDRGRATAHWESFTESLTEPDPDLRRLLRQAPGASRPDLPGGVAGEGT